MPPAIPATLRPTVEARNPRRATIVATKLATATKPMRVAHAIKGLSRVPSGHAVNADALRVQPSKAVALRWLRNRMWARTIGEA